LRLRSNSSALAVATASLRRPLDFVWTGLAVIGLLLLLPLTASVHAIDPVGAMLALAAGACWAIYILSGQRAGKSHGTHAVAWGSIVAAFVAGPIGLAHAGTALFDPAILPLALLVAALSSALPYVLEMIALTGMPTRAYATITCLEPGLGALTGALFLGEALSLVQWLGIAAVATASAGTMATTQKPLPAPDVDAID
jgi:inner membrane transporter RhtA